MQSIKEIDDQIIASYQRNIDLQAFEPIGRYLCNRRQRITRDEADINELLKIIRARPVEWQTRIVSWSIPAQGFEAITGGLLNPITAAATALRMPMSSPVARSSTSGASGSNTMGTTPGCCGLLGSS